jgi:hypothetical protein
MTYLNDYTDLDIFFIQNRKNFIPDRVKRAIKKQKEGYVFINYVAFHDLRLQLMKCCDKLMHEFYDLKAFLKRRNDTSKIDENIIYYICKNDEITEIHNKMMNFKPILNIPENYFDEVDRIKTLSDKY